MSQLGEIDLSNFDRAIYEALGADFLPFPNPDGHELLKRNMRQARIPGIHGPGYTDADEQEGRVPVVYNYPEDVYNRYLLPGIRVKRNESVEDDNSRRGGWQAGYKYRVPSDNGSPVESGGRQGHTHYVMRPHAEPVFLTYDIEVRARHQREAQILRKYVRRKIKDRSFIEVRDSIEEPSHFTVFRQSDQEVSEFISSLNRFHGYMLSFRIEGELDDHEEYEERALTSSPTIQRTKK